MPDKETDGRRDEPPDGASKSRLEFAWQRYKDEPRYQAGPYPFRRRRMNLFDKLNSDFVALVSLVGGIWLAVRLIRYVIGY
ncbi:hypothetical protein [Mesorhizobium sp.]|uniref:hypothetical protein n=1 Tax=Mesorhizobium sp. TaxID=1871066 RepID=UPI000FE85F20|nr:hypothetical protein [Mesorhizobium sp.]RWD70287.1 MAG: hypothetical protein EOS37_15320 [Mesorhizobium sp.]